MLHSPKCRLGTDWWICLTAAHVTWCVVRVTVSKRPYKLFAIRLAPIISLSYTFSSLSSSAFHSLFCAFFNRRNLLIFFHHYGCVIMRGEALFCSSSGQFLCMWSFWSPWLLPFSEGCFGLPALHYAILLDLWARPALATTEPSGLLQDTARSATHSRRMRMSRIVWPKQIEWS